MGFSNAPSATAAMSVPIPYPVQTVLSCGFETTVEGWTAADTTNTYTLRSSSYGSVSGSFALALVTNAAAPVGTYYLDRVVTGLQVGRTYTFAAWGRYPSSFTLGVAGKGSTSVAASSGAYTRGEYAFVATATTHTLRVGVASTSTGNFVRLTVDDVTLTGAAFVDLSTTTTLTATAGELTMDKGRLPFVSGSVTVPILSDTLADQLDPFIRQRIIIDATDGATSRSFDLALLRRTVSHDEKSIELEVGTDEALLQTFRDVTEDITAFSRQSSLRSIINAVIAKVIPGRALEAGGAADVPFWTYTDATNLTANGAAAVDLSGWTGGGNMSRLTDVSIPGVPVTTSARVTKTGAETGGLYLQSDSIAPLTAVQGSKSYTVSAWVRASVAKTVRLSVQMKDSGGVQVSNLDSAPTALVAGVWTKLVFVFTAHASASRLGVYSYLASGAWAAGQTYDMTAVRVSETDPRPGVDSDFYDGSTPSTSEYAYAWSGTPRASNSTRRALIARAPELLVWRAGVDAWSFLEPLLTSAKMRLWCDEQRKWRLYDPDTFEVPGRVVAQVSNTSIGSDVLDLAGGEYATGVIARFTWTDYAGVRQTRDDVAGVGPFVIVEEFDRPYPGPGTATLILLRRSGRKRTQAVTVGARYDITPGMEIGISLPGTNDQLGRLQGVRWNLTEGVMELTSVGLLEITPGSWLARTPTQDWSAVPDAETWASLT